MLLIYLMSILIMFSCWPFIWCSVWRRMKHDDNNNWLLWGQLMSRPLLTHNWVLLSGLNTLILINSRMGWILLFFPDLILIGYLLSKSLIWCGLLILHSQLSQALWWHPTLISFLQFVRAELCAGRHHSSVSNLMPIFWTSYNQVKIIGCIWFNFTCTLIPYISSRGKLATVAGSGGNSWI